MIHATTYMDWSGNQLASRGITHFIRRRLLFVLIALVFAMAFCWNYLTFQTVELAGAGAAYFATPEYAWVAAFIFYLLPACVIPFEFKRPSSLFLFFQYVLVCMPASFVPIFRREMPLGHCILLSAAYSAAMLILWVGIRLPRRILPIPRMPSFIAWTAFGVLYAALNGIVLTLGPHWQIVSFGDVYDLVRQQAIDRNANGYLYAYVNLIYAMNPFLIAAGLARRRYSVVVVGVADNLFMYGFGGFKSTLFVPLAVIGMYVFAKKARVMGTKIIVVLTLLILGVSAIYIFFPSPAALLTNMLYNYRVLAMAGISAGSFDYFANTYGFTYWSHLHIVNLFIHYPFQMDVASEVGWLENGFNVQQNTGFLTTDGTAALGILGIPIIAAIASIVFWIIDSCASPHSRAFAIAAAATCALVLTNMGLLTMLVTGGLGLLILLFLFMPIIEERPAHIENLEFDIQ